MASSVSSNSRGSSLATAVITAVNKSSLPPFHFLGAYMKWLVAIAMLASAFDARAALVIGDPPLTSETKARLVQILKGALHDKHITRKQYDQSIFWMNATPCNGVDRQLSARMKAELEAAIANQQGRKTVKVFQSFRYGAWFVLYTDASDGDEPFMFYSKDPLKGSLPVTIWSGAATIFETSEVAQWVRENAPGIPTQLANCFAWHVTLSRDE